MVWAVVNFGILVAILNKFLFKPILGVMDERAAEVSANIDKAEADRIEAERMKAEYDSALTNARKEAAGIVSEAQKTAESKKEEILQSARTEAEEMHENALKKIADERESAFHDLKGEISTLAVRIAEKIVKKTINPDDHGNMVQDFAEEVGELH